MKGTVHTQEPSSGSRLHSCAFATEAVSAPGPSAAQNSAAMLTLAALRTILKVQQLRPLTLAADQAFDS